MAGEAQVMTVSAETTADPAAESAAAAETEVEMVKKAVARRADDPMGRVWAKHNPDDAISNVYTDGIDEVEAMYVGTTKNGRLEGTGTYTFANGSVYRGGFLDGQLHGHGTITFPNGQIFEAEWVHGKSRGEGTARGVLTFKDGLRYGEVDYDYCDQDDRRFHSERVGGLKPGGETQKTDSESPADIPVGMFDVGDGYYSADAKTVYSYNHEPLRKPSEEDQEWIVKHCRIGVLPS
mmetsp:Transcript_5562/g.16753  ORF Transcript_5562/g.16753 Transcript_5562/m.16753 type:complete len:236 (+) Transcript_5562:144-851(+)